MLGTTVAVSSTADAQSGRRACVYSSWAASNHFPVWAMNFRKSGDCPNNSNQDSLSSTAQIIPVSKLTCEIFSINVLGVSNNDPCPKMTPDVMYKITKDASGLHYEAHGHY
jgi:hypothetical protein